MQSPASTTRVVIIGGGFGGLAAAHGLRRHDVEVVLIDRRNHHLFQPLLYQVATAGLTAGDVTRPIRSILREQRNVRVVMAEVVAIDPPRQSVSLSDGSTVPYDTLILAAGSTHSYFGHDEWAAHAPGLKTVEDAMRIRAKVLAAFEKAEHEPDPTRRRALLSFVVIGGGPTGVELAGAIAEMARRALRDYRCLDPFSARVVLVEGRDRVLGSFPASLSADAHRQLRGHGVEVLTSTQVLSVDASGVDTSSGRIDAGTVLWAAGVAASPLARSLGVPLDPSGRVLVGPDLSVPGHPEILVIGDLALIVGSGGVVPSVAPAATQAGRHAARVVRADLCDRPRPAFRYFDRGAIATVGRSFAVADLRRLGRHRGRRAWVLWWLVHLVYLRGARNRLSAGLTWASQWLGLDRHARLIAFDPPPNASGPARRQASRPVHPSGPAVAASSPARELVSADCR